MIPAELEDLERSLEDVLEEVRIAVGDFPVMQEKTRQILETMEKPPANLSKDKVAEAREFLNG